MNFPEFEYLGPYKVERTLGRGGMGTVYKGIHAQSGEAVAIKVIATGIANNMRFRRRFAAEVETLKRLKHPHIVQLVGYGEEQGLLFYSMEYVDGHSLHDHLRQHSRLPWSEVIQIGIETTAALKHAHDIGIIHRDLKPANLMLNKVGRIKLTDFGIAKLFGSTDMTAAGSVIGTADYMPPEQAEGKAVTIRSDLYSLGGVLYALLAGKAPFGGKSVPEVLYSVRYNSVPDLRERVPDVPRELAELIHQLLEKDPGQRPPTALVVGNRLKSLQQGLKRLGSGLGSGPHSTDGSPPKPPGTQLTSLDLSDVDDQELRLTSTAHSQASQPAGQPPAPATGEPAIDPGAPPLGTHELQTLVAPEGMVAPPSDEKFTAIAGDGRSPQGNSAEASADFQSAAPSGAPITSGGPSHFTPIGDKPPKTTSFGSDDDEPQPTIDWLHYGSVAGLVCLLLGCIGLGWWLLRPASANHLYAEVSAAVASGDDAQLLQASGLIDEFLTRYPDDERSAELQALSDEVELARWSKVLQRRASRSGGVENLSVIEQGFLQGVQLLSEDSQKAQTKLAAFVEIFGSQTNLSRNDQRLVDLAKYALRVGTTRVKVEAPASAVELQNLISSAEASMTSTQLTTFYQNLINLYGDLPWAKEHIERIRTLLKAGG
jgi:serine/threonine protein kinase